MLFLPLGPVLLCRRADAFACLPLPLALARLGCLAAGCCRGSAGEPLPVLEIVVCVAGHFAIRSLPVPARRGAFLTGFGALRLCETPLRPPGDALLDPAWLACAWLAGGALWLARSATPR